MRWICRDQRKQWYEHHRFGEHHRYIWISHFIPGLPKSNFFLLKRPDVFRRFQSLIGSNRNITSLNSTSPFAEASHNTQLHSTLIIYSVTFFRSRPAFGKITVLYFVYTRDLSLHIAINDTLFIACDCAFPKSIVFLKRRSSPLYCSLNSWGIHTS